MMDSLTILLSYPAIVASSIASFIAISRARALHLELRSIHSAQVPQIVVTSPDSAPSANCCSETKSRKKCCARGKAIRFLIAGTVFSILVGAELWFLWTSTEEAVSTFYDFLVRFSINMAALTFTIHLLGVCPDVAVVLPPLGSPLMSKVKNYKICAKKYGSYMIEPTNLKLKITLMLLICLFSSFGYNYVQDSGVPTDAEWMNLEQEKQPVFYWLVRGYYWVRNNESLKQACWMWMKVSVVYAMGLIKFGKKASLKKVFAHMLGLEALILIIPYLLTSPSSPFSLASPSGEITSILPEPKSDPTQWMKPFHWEYSAAFLYGFVAILVRIAARYDFVKSTKFGEIALPKEDANRVEKEEKALPIAVQNMGSLSTELPRFKVPYMFSIPAFKPFYSAILLFVAAAVPEILRCLIKHSELPEDIRVVLEGSGWGYLVVFVQVPVMFVTLLVVSLLRGERDVWSWEERWGWDSEAQDLKNQCR